MIITPKSKKLSGENVYLHCIRGLFWWLLIGDVLMYYSKHMSMKMWPKIKTHFSYEQIYMHFQQDFDTGKRKIIELGFSFSVNLNKHVAMM